MHCPRLQSVVRPPSLTSVPAGTPMAQVLPVPCGLVVAYDLPDPGDNSFDDFMCATSVVAGTWAIRSAYVGGAMILMGGVPSAASFFVAGLIGAYSMFAGLAFCGE